MKHCAACGRDIPESATVCEPCEQWAAEHVTPLFTPPASSSAEPLAASSSEPLFPLALPEPDFSLERDIEPSVEPLDANSPELLFVPTSPQAVSSPDTAPISVPAARAKRLGGRELLLVVGALSAAGIVAFTLLSKRGVPTTRVAAAPATAVKPQRVVVPKLKPAMVPTQAWSSERRAYWTGNQRHSAAFELPAENTVPIWLSQVRPLLIVRCIAKKTDVFVFTGSALKIEAQTEDHTVNFRFDDEQGTTVRWPDSAEHDALFAPDPIGFAQKLMHARTLRFGYTPHNAAPVEALFEVRGITTVTETVAKECGWKK